MDIVQYDPEFRLAVPSAARRVVVESWPSCASRLIQYQLGDDIVAKRWVAEEDPGTFSEWSLVNGKKHGLEVRYDAGELVSIEPYVDGLPHGVAQQWDAGELIGEYRMSHGTGIDLWRGRRENGSPYLAEISHFVAGQRHGFEWWLCEDQQTVYLERHWCDGQLHGIEREWNPRGRLCRGYPRYHILGERVDKRRYLRACEADLTLPRFDMADNDPTRTFLHNRTD